MLTPEQIMAWAIPGFFVLMALEWAIGRWRGRPAYAAADTINSLGLGVISQIVGVFTKLLTIGLYAWCFEHLALWRLPADRWWVWLSSLLLYDLLYYWLHRMGHEVNLLWAAHVVHHQSEHYNLSTALRQTGSGFLFGWLFYLPMALLGYPTELFAVVALIDLLYQFWVHTEQVGRLGWFDKVFCSPSNHRAHHAVNERYLDRNYGGILILWDRLFGTFVEEDATDPPVYGTRAPLRSWNPLWANAEVYWATAREAWHARRWRDRLQIWLRRPGWRPADVAARFPKPSFELHRARYAPTLPPGWLAYAAAQFVLLLAMGVHFLQVAPRLPLPWALAYAGYQVATLYVLGGWLEGRRALALLELPRLALTMVLPWLGAGWFGTPLEQPWLGWLVVGLALASALVALGLLRRRPLAEGDALATG